MKNILFISTALGNGGAERVMLYLMNHLIVKGYEVSLLLIRNQGNDYLSDLSKEVKVYRLGLDNKRIRFCICPILKAICHIKPNICFIGHVELNILIAPFIRFMPSCINFIARETSVLSVRYRKQKWKKILYYLFYRNYKLIIAQSKDMRNDLIDNWHVSPFKCIKINNPIDIQYVIEKSQKEISVPFFSSKTFNLIAIGKLDYQKGYDILFTRLSELKNKDFRLIILGKGLLRDALQRQIDQLNLSENIRLEGFSPYSAAYITKADGLILSSRFEGFPNVLLEANALGKPVFANNCLGGINEIVINGINGYATNFLSSQNFTETYLKFRNTKFDKTIIQQTIEDRYSQKRIMPLYEKAINALL